jgi:hypothetical protein
MWLHDASIINGTYDSSSAVIAGYAWLQLWMWLYVAFIIFISHSKIWFIFIAAGYAWLQLWMWLGASIILGFHYKTS